MSALEGGSVPPPGWNEPGTRPLVVNAVAAAVSAPVSLGVGVSTPVAVSEQPAPPVAVSGQPATHAAVEWRIRAAIIDNLLLLALYGLICGVLHWRFLTLTHQLVFLGLDIAYHFALESRDGQTIGKRSSGIRVVALDGSPARPKAIAIRSVLRVIDSLPVWYLSGLVNMVRTGPRRRQRIGDVAAETKVIAVGGRALTGGTGRWLLPTVTLIALFASVGNVLAIVRAGSEPLTSSQQVAFVAGCERTSGRVINCQCLLNQLEAHGYTTANGIVSLIQQARAEEFSNQSGSARTEMTSDGLACRQ